MFLVWWLSSARTQLDSLLMMTDIASIFFMTQQLSHAIAFKEVQSWASQFHRLSLSYWMLDRFCLLVELPISQGLAWHCACRIYVCAVQCRDHLTCNSNWFVTVANLFFFFHQFIFLELFCWQGRGGRTFGRVETSRSSIFLSFGVSLQGCRSNGTDALTLLYSFSDIFIFEISERFS